MRKMYLILLLLSGHIIFVGTAMAVDLAGVEIHGFISQGYLYTDENNYMADTEGGTFQFNEMGLNFSMSPIDSLHIALQIFSRDLGEIGNNDVVIGYAFGDYRWRDWLGVRAGKIKLDYGLYNETREMDMLRTCVMLPQSVYPEVWRDSFSNINGGSVYGYIPAGVAGKFSYGFQIGAMTFDEDEGFVKYFRPKINEELVLSDMDSDYAWFTNLQWHTPLPGLKVKGSYYSIEGLAVEGNLTMSNMEGDIIDTTANYDFSKKYGYIVSLEYIWKNLTLSAEYSEDTYKFDVDLGINDDGFTPPEGGAPDITSQGWYISASYRFTDWFESALTYSEYYPNKDNKDGDAGRGGDGMVDPNAKDMSFTAWLKTTTLSTRFDINEYCLLKLEGSYNDGFGGVNLADNDENDLEDNWWLFAAKVTFSF